MKPKDTLLLRRAKNLRLLKNFLEINDFGCPLKKMQCSQQKSPHQRAFIMFVFYFKAQP